MSLTWIDHPAVRKELELVDYAEFKDGDKALQRAAQGLGLP